MIKRLFDRFKHMKDAYKLWLFVVALFATNGLQAVLNAPEVVEPVEGVMPVECPVCAKPTKCPVIVDPIKGTTTVILQCKEYMTDHVEEHHGGIHATVRE